MTQPIMSSQLVHDALDGYDPLEIFNDYWILQTTGSWGIPNVPEWARALEDAFDCQLSVVVVITSVPAYLFDLLVREARARDMHDLLLLRIRTLVGNEYIDSASS